MALPQDPKSDDPTFTVVNNEIFASFFPDTTTTTGGTPPTITTSGPSGNVATVSGSGIAINLIFDNAAMSASASLRVGVEQAASILASMITDKITVNLNIDISGSGGGAAAGPDHGLYVSYSTVRSDLINNATPGDTTFNTLPAGSSIQGQSSVAVWNAQLKLWGLIAANDTTTDDGSAYFSADINPNLIVGVALHELTHALGRIPYGAAPDVFDLSRFTSSGVRLFQGGATAPAAYFSVNGGATKLADYGQASDASDFLNSGVQGANDPFNEYYSSSTVQFLSNVDLQQLDALGFHLLTTTNRAPVAAAVQANVSAALGATFKATDLFMFGDPDGNETLYSVAVTESNTSGAGSWYYNGSKVTGSITVGIQNVNLLEYHATGAGSENITLKVSDGQTWSNTATVAVTVAASVNHAPVAAAVQASESVLLGAVLKATDLFTYNDPDGNSTLYSVTVTESDTVAGGSWYYNGSKVTGSINVGIQNIGQLEYHADNAGTETLTLTVSDGQAWSNAATTAITVSAPINHAPVATAVQASETVQPGAVLKVADLFSYSDADGNSTLYSATVGESDTAGEGSWYYNGSKVTGSINVGIQNVGLLEYHATNTGTENLTLQVSDGQTWSNAATTAVTIAAPVNHAPVTTAVQANLSATLGAVFKATDLFTFSDPDGNSTLYSVTVAESNTASAGSWYYNGAKVTGSINVGIQNVSLLEYHATGTGTENITMQVSDGQAWSNTATTAVTVSAPVNHPPVTAADQASLAVQVGAIFKVQDVFTFSDPDGNSTLYSATVTESDTAGAGSWFYNGSQVAGSINVGIQNIGLLEYHATATGTENITLQVSDGQAWSNVSTTAVTVTAPSPTALHHVEPDPITPPLHNSLSDFHLA